ncbi:hypothetical protein ACFY8W_04015 [Streptomyces sp. NPDC012637]|uniref:hypothetical protein n=1 Tax=Streptomyces sp. NPDC012637 TaxID=3364842 RepID=UPI0036E95063
MAEKEQAISPQRIARIAAEVKAVCPTFDDDAFTREVCADLPGLKLKERIAHTSEALRHHLPGSPMEALEVLLRSLPPTPEAAGITNGSGLHIYSPHTDFVARYCRHGGDLEHSLDALRRLTQYFTAEDAVRYFLSDFPEETLKAVDRWARNPEFRVRRLASESTRPRLPGSINIPLDVEVALPVLDQLYADPHRYVTTSVANHLHDIATTRLDLVLQTLGRWMSEGRARDTELAFIMRGALRSRLKDGDTKAFTFLGYPAEPPVELSSLRLEAATLRDGDHLLFAAALTASAPARLRISYVLTSPTARGSTRRKVYELKDVSVDAGQVLDLVKAHPFRSTATHTIRPGTHSLEIQVNGRRFPAVTFTVVESAP